MKTRPTFFSIVLFLTISLGFAQKRNEPVNMITGKVNIAKYHSYDELNDLPKGTLLNLYIERIEVIINILPNIAFATKPDVTMASLGIPETKDNKKALKANRKASVEYFDSTVKFQSTILPYSDTRDLVVAIMFYEETLKSLHTYNDFKAD